MKFLVSCSWPKRNLRRSISLTIRFAQTVPYADPRSPYHRKQAFDFGDGGLGHAVNNLTLGCDCLGLIKVSELIL